MSAHTDPIGHAVETQFVLRLEQAAANQTTTTDTTGRSPR